MTIEIRRLNENTHSRIVHGDSLYVHDFLGTPTPPEQLKSFITMTVYLPGYNNNLVEELPLLTWQWYGDQLADLLLHHKQTVRLVGNSLGCMISLYANHKCSELIQEILLYQVPRFGVLREPVKKKYSEIADFLTSKEAYLEFRETIQDSIEPRILSVMDQLGWQKLQHLYRGAALSDLTLENQSITTPVTWIDDGRFSWQHPIEAVEA
jgi:pimeloyl-ACP methyl ester carboxylesterase